MEVVTDFLFLGSKITATVKCSYEIRRRLLLGRKTMTNLDSVLKSRDITLLRNVGLDELQIRIKIGGRNINNLRYADDITLMAESKEELKSLLMRVKEESERAGLKLNIL